MVAVDDKDAQHIYVTYAINTEFDNNTSLANDNVVVQDSTDGGKTWKTERRVTVSGNTKGRRFMPWVCAVDGTAHVSWYDRRAATAANNDLTDYFRGGATLNNAGNLVAGMDVQVNQAGTADAQCASGWPGSVFSPNDSDSCSVQPQRAGVCSVSGARCDFDQPALAGCPRTGETCNATGGQPKYGDYNGNACAAGRLYLAWASATPPGSGGIDIFFESFPQIEQGEVTSFTGRAHGVGKGTKTAGVAIIGIFTFDGVIDLSAFPATVTLTSLFNEVGGAGEVVAGLPPLTLFADPRNNANVARFNTPMGTLPIAKVTIGAKGGGRFTFRVDVAKATIVPPSCPTTNLTTSFTIDDGFNPLFPSVTVTTLQPWLCFGAGNKYLKSPPP
jgi:hypothetical protein